MKRIIILGATGSIGVQALQVVAASSDLTVVGLSCHRNVGLLLEQAVSLGVRDLAVADNVAAETVTPTLYPELELRAGTDAAARLVGEVEADLVLNAIVGFAGLESTIAALEGDRPVALANKESLVCAGSLVTDLATRRETRILPVDSEHSALFQLINSADRRNVGSVVITSSGGPFRGMKRDELAKVTRAEALAHPTWSMGEKISVDSATLMNKGLEVIEAHHLFGLGYDQIEVVLHPQSLVHALVRLIDGSLLAHVGPADMRVPIAYALHYPERAPVDVRPLQFSDGLTLEFTAPDEETFPAVKMAREAGARGDAATCALNAANEVAVNAFLEGQLPFSGIYEVVGEVLARSTGGELGTYAEAAAVDEWARDKAANICAGLSTRR